MTRKEQNKILDDKIKSNINQYKVDRLNAEISAFSSGDLNKYEFLTRKDLKYKPNALDKARFQFSPLGQTFSIGLDKTAQGYQKEGVMKLLKDIIRDFLRGGVRLPGPDDNNDDNNNNNDNNVDDNDNDDDNDDDNNDYDNNDDDNDNDDDNNDDDNDNDDDDDDIDNDDDNNDDDNDNDDDNVDNNNKFSEYQEVISSLLEEINNKKYTNDNDGDNDDDDDNDDNVALNSVFLNNLNNEISNIKNDGEYYVRLIAYQNATIEKLKKELTDRKNLTKDTIDLINNNNEYLIKENNEIQDKV